MAAGKLLRAGSMHRLSALFLCLMLVLSLGFGSVAHAAEGPGVEVSTVTSIGHADGDGDQVPADSQKGYPHHHGWMPRPRYRRSDGARSRGVRHRTARSPVGMGQGSDAARTFGPGASTTPSLSDV